MTDLILAIVHHLIVFSLVALLASELALVRPGISGGALERVAIVDGAYGACAALILVVGVLRVVFGFKGPHYYLHNEWFWAKMGTIVAVALISIAPTISVLRWRSTARKSSGFIPTEAAVARVRRFIVVELSLLSSCWCSPRRWRAGLDPELRDRLAARGIGAAPRPRGSL